MLSILRIKQRPKHLARSCNQNDCNEASEMLRLRSA